MVAKLKDHDMKDFTLKEKKKLKKVLDSPPKNYSKPKDIKSTIIKDKEMQEIFIFLDIVLHIIFGQHLLISEKVMDDILRVEVIKVFTTDSAVERS